MSTTVFTIHIGFKDDLNCFTAKEIHMVTNVEPRVMPNYFTEDIVKEITSTIHASPKTLNDLKIDIQLKFPSIPKNRIEHKIKELAVKTKTPTGLKWMIKASLSPEE